MRFPKWPVSDGRERALLEEVLEADQWGGFHPMVARFEQEFARYQHCAHGIAAANGTLTLEIMLQAAGIGPGDEVIVPAISFVSTATAVSRVGAAPVFVDIEEDSYQMSFERAVEALSPRTKAILLVHFGGPLANLDRFPALCAERRILLFEDAAHAHGAEWNGRRAGSFSLGASFSFQNGKVMTAGEGGIIVTRDEAFAARCRGLANQGRRPGATFFHHFELATNARLTALQAAVLLAQLERLDAQIDLRERNAALLFEQLAGCQGVRWQQVDPRVNRHPWYLVLGRAPGRRDAFHRQLTARGVPATPFYPHPLYANPLYETAPCRVMPCPNAEGRIGDAFWLPHRVLMGDADTVRELAGAIREALEQEAR